jgi:hypothetical protein
MIKYGKRRGEKNASVRQSSAAQRSGAVNRPLRPPFAGAGRLPLPNPFKGAILGTKSAEAGEE